MFPNHNAASPARAVAPTTTTVIGRSAGAPDAPPDVPLPAHLEEVIRRGVSPSFANLARARPDLFRPTISSGTSFAEERPQLLQYPRMANDIYLMVRHAPMLAAAVLAVRNGVMRKPPEIVPAFGARCTTCGWTSEQALKKCANIDCGGTTEPPDPAQKERLALILNSPSATGAGFAELIEWLEDDVNTLDDAVMVMEFDYDYNLDTGQLTSDPRLTGLERANPATLSIAADARGQWYNVDENGDPQGFFTCWEHRKDNVQTDARLPCYACGAPLQPARWVLFEQHRARMAYFDSEVVHWSKYFPSEIWGFSPVITVWTLTRASVSFDMMLAREAEQNRPPKGMIVFVTSNPRSLEAEILTELEESRRDPLYIPVIAVESTHEKGGAQWIPFTLSPIELDLVNTRHEMREQIIAVFNLQPIEVSDPQSSGGLNNESMQLEAASRAVERAHNIWHHRVFPKITDAAGVTDWKIEFPSPFERDAASKADVRTKNIELALKVVGAGGEIDPDSFDEETWEFKWTGELKPAPSPFEGPEGPDGGGQPEWEGGDGEEAPGNDEEEVGRAVGPGGRSGLLRAFLGAWGRMEGRLAKEFAVARDPGPAKVLASRVVEDVVGNLQGIARTHYATLLQKGFRDAGVPLADAGMIEGAVRALSETSPLWRAFAGMNVSMSDKLNAVVEDAFTSPYGYDVSAMVRSMKEVVSVESYRLARIARTESQHVVSVGRELGYTERDPEGNYRYDWAGPKKDHRSSEVCQWIKQQIPPGGVPINDLKAIVRAGATKFMGARWVTRDWTPHPSCRHAPRRKVRR